MSEVTKKLVRVFIVDSEDCGSIHCVHPLERQADGVVPYFLWWILSDTNHGGFLLQGKLYNSRLNEEILTVELDTRLNSWHRSQVRAASVPDSASRSSSRRLVGDSEVQVPKSRRQRAAVQDDISISGDTIGGGSITRGVEGVDGVEAEL